MSSWSAAQTDPFFWVSLHGLGFISSNVGGGRDVVPFVSCMHSLLLSLFLLLKTVRHSITIADLVKEFEGITSILIKLPMS